MPRHTRLKKALLVTGTLLFWVALWAVGALIVQKDLLLPAPWTVLARLAALLPTGAFWRAAGFSLLRVLLGIGIALVLGILLAAATAHSRLLTALLTPPMAVVKATPVASFILLALVWIGRDVLPVFIALLIVLPVVYTNVREGILRADRQLLEVARVFGLSRFDRLRYVRIPAVLPYLESACRSAFGLAWKAGIAAEVLAQSTNSIGRKIYESKQYFETPNLFAWTLTVILLSLALERLLLALPGLFRKRVRRAELPTALKEESDRALL
jgi:NitT/TauT family transport system permease protein